MVFTEEEKRYAFPSLPENDLLISSSCSQRIREDERSKADRGEETKTRGPGRNEEGEEGQMKVGGVGDERAVSVSSRTLRERERERCMLT